MAKLHLLPTKARTGRPADHPCDHQRHFMDSPHGAPWDDLPARYGSRGTVSSLYRWRSQGIWQEILNRLQQTADAADQIDWEVHFVDSTIVRAHQQAAGAKGELNPGQQSLSVEQMQQQEALGRSKGGFSTKIHIQAEGMGKPMQFVLTEGQRSDLKIRHPQYCAEGQAYWTKTEATSRYLVGDKGYDSQTIRRTDAPSAHHTSHPQAQEC